MQSKKEFYSQITKELNAGREEIKKLGKKLANTERMINSGHFSTQYVNNDLTPERQELRRQIESLKAATGQKINALCGEYVEELQNADVLDGRELTDDARLLTAGVKLNERDIKAALSRNAGNKTMTRLLLRYCDEHGIKAGVVYEGNQSIINAVNEIPKVSEVVLRWSDDSENDVYERFMGDGSELSQAFED